jgi:uncharacterized membrane protein YjdF
MWLFSSREHWITDLFVDEGNDGGGMMSDVIGWADTIVISTFLLVAMLGGRLGWAKRKEWKEREIMWLTGRCFERPSDSRWAGHRRNTFGHFRSTLISIGLFSWLWVRRWNGRGCVTPLTSPLVLCAASLTCRWYRYWYKIRGRSGWNGHICSYSYY